MSGGRNEEPPFDRPGQVIPEDSRQHADDRAFVGARSVRAVAARVASCRRRRFDRGLREGRRSVREKLTTGSTRRHAAKARLSPAEKFSNVSKFVTSWYS